MSKKAGVSPLGHSPFGKEKLEGPKKHHDIHGKTDSQPAMGNKRAIPNEHWERSYNPDPESNTKSGAFDPKCPDKRPCVHNKVNETDH